MANALTEYSDTDFVISAGDQVETANTESHYDGFLIDELRSIPLAPTVGNHDRHSNYMGHFNVPNLSELGADSHGSGGDYYYTYKNALFMHINSNNSSAASHKEFLEQSIRDLRSDLSPVFAELDIDLVLAGHDHVYTRSFMMGGETGMTPITTGYSEVDDDDFGAYTKTENGETLYITANSASGSKHYALTPTDFGFVASQNQENVANISKLDFGTDDITINTYRSSDLSVIDTFTLSKPEPEWKNYPILTAFATFTGDGDLVARIDADFSKFQTLTKEIDTIDQAHWTATSGSTIITIKESHLLALENGNHYYTANFIDGEARLLVNVDVKTAVKANELTPQNSTNSTQTGDRIVIHIILALLCFSMAIMLILHERRKQEAH